jgi:hypothetical protein
MFTEQEEEEEEEEEDAKEAAEISLEKAKAALQVRGHTRRNLLAIPQKSPINFGKSYPEIFIQKSIASLLSNSTLAWIQVDSREFSQDAAGRWLRVCWR